jgi:hypothetical protein
MTYARKPSSRLYTPPPGFYDVPFTWAYDASQLTPGLAYPNQYLYLQNQAFVLRRIVGLSRILNPATGQYQIRDNDNNNIEQFPVFGVSADDIGLAPELIYEPTGAIKFDLGIIDLPGVPSTGQVAFQGVKRLKGSPPNNPTYKATPKTFTFILAAPVNPPIGSFVTVRQPITDYDFELHQIILLYSPIAAASQLYGDDESVLLVTAVTPGAAGNNIVMEFDAGSPFPANQPESVSVVGNVIKYVPATNNLGQVIYNPPTQGTNLQLLNAFAASPAASALVTVALHSGPITASGWGKIPSPGNLGGGSGGGLVPVDPISALWLYDSNKIQVSNAPVMDIYMDGGPGGVYKNGAIVPPLWYPKDSQIQIDVYSELPSGSAELTILLVGKKYYPC